MDCRGGRERQRVSVFRTKKALWLPVLGVVLAFAGCAPSPHDCAARGENTLLEQVLEKCPGGGNALDRKKKTPLHIAVGANNLEAMALLVAHGGDLDAADITGMTPLHVAAMLGRVDAAAWLLDHGAARDSADLFGDTPLHTAAVFGQGGVARLLVQRGASLDGRNKDGKTPRELAVEHRHDRVRALLDRLAGAERSGV